MDGQPTLLQAWQPGMWRLEGTESAQVVAGVIDRTATLDALRARPECAGGLIQAEQVHGASIAAVDMVPARFKLIGRNPMGFDTPVAHPRRFASRLRSKPKLWGYPGSVAGCDALVTSRSHVALIIRTADCVPLYMWDAVKRVVGLAHVGWRGMVKALPMRLAAFLKDHYHSRPDDLWWGIGPAIRACCYEVGQEFEPRFGQFVRTARGGRRTCDLAGVAIEQLRRCGMRMAQVLDAGVCTACHAERWFSVRREGDATGRLHSFIMIATHA